MDTRLELQSQWVCTGEGAEKEDLKARLKILQSEHQVEMEYHLERNVPALNWLHHPLPTPSPTAATDTTGNAIVTSGLSTAALELIDYAKRCETKLDKTVESVLRLEETMVRF